MLTYIKGKSNGYTLRTEQLPTGVEYLTLTLQDMTTQNNYSVSLSPGQWSYNTAESFVSFSVNLDSVTSNAPQGAEFRATLKPATYICADTTLTVFDEVWHGSIGFFVSQSVDKTQYTNQIPLSGSITSHTSSNSYIIYS